MHLEVEKGMNHRSAGGSEEGHAQKGVPDLLRLKRLNQHPSKSVKPCQSKKPKSNQAIVGDQLQIFIVGMAGNDAGALEAIAEFGEGIAIITGPKAYQRLLFDRITVPV